MSVPDPSWDSASDQISAHSLQDRVEVSCILCLYSVHPSGSAEALSEKSGFFLCIIAWIISSFIGNLLPLPAGALYGAGSN